MWYRLLPTLALGALAATVTTRAHGAPVTVSDGEFAAADWTVQVVQDSTLGASAEAVGVHQATGGNPDAFRALSNGWSHDGTGSSTVVGGHLRAALDYAPATEGAVGTIDFSLDVETTLTTYLTEAPLVFFPLLEQGNTIYAAELGSQSSAAWSSLHWGPWTATDFTPYAGDTMGPPHPDFSTAGAALRFGVAVQSGPYDQAGTFTTEGGMDNWSVTLAEPSDAGTGGAGAAGAGGGAGAGATAGHGSIPIPPAGPGAATGPPRDDGNCACALRAEARPPWMMLAVGLGALAARAASRRQRARSR
jgi:hypothetical protein